MNTILEIMTGNRPNSSRNEDMPHEPQTKASSSAGAITRRTTVCGGVTIGDGAVIGAGRVVTRDIPAGVAAAGSPCRVLREITEGDRISPEDIA